MASPATLAMEMATRASRKAANRSASLAAAGTANGRTSIGAARTIPISAAASPFEASQTGRNGRVIPAYTKNAA